MMTLNYTDLENEILGILNQQKLWMLATSSQNRVTARTVSIVNHGLTFYFQTDMNFEKYRQICGNPNVALCYSNIQIEGAAESIGSLTDEPNALIATAYQATHPASYSKYAHLPNEVLIRVTPLLITLWKYIDGKPCRDFMNVQAQTVQREYYDMAQ